MGAPLCAVLGFKCAVVRGPDVFPVGEEVTVNRNAEVSHLITAWKTLRGDVHAALRGRAQVASGPRRSERPPAPAAWVGEATRRGRAGGGWRRGRRVIGGWAEAAEVRGRDSGGRVPAVLVWWPAWSSSGLGVAETTGDSSRTRRAGWKQGFRVRLTEGLRPECSPAGCLVTSACDVVAGTAQQEARMW